LGGTEIILGSSYEQISMSGKENEVGLLDIGGRRGRYAGRNFTLKSGLVSSGADSSNLSSTDSEYQQDFLIGTNNASTNFESLNSSQPMLEKRELSDKERPKQINRTKRYTFLYDVLENVDISLSISMEPRSIHLDIAIRGLAFNFDPSSFGLFSSLLDNYLKLFENLLNKNSGGDSTQQGGLIFEKLSCNLNFDRADLNLLSRVETESQFRKENEKEVENELLSSSGQSRFVDLSRGSAKFSSHYHVVLSITLRKTSLRFIIIFHNRESAKSRVQEKSSIEFFMSTLIRIAYANFADFTQQILADEFPFSIYARHLLSDDPAVLIESPNHDSSLEPCSLLKISIKDGVEVQFESSLVHLLHIIVKKAQMSLTVCSYSSHF
jgi:hypothetical protein